MIISDYVPKGKENAVSKSMLVKITGVDERIVRKNLKEENERLINEEGVAIVSTASRNGYWKSDDLAELEAYEAEQRHRAAMILENLKPIRSLIERIKEADQMKL